jgi:hypothetical protein
MADDPHDDEAEAYLQHTLMEETQSYLERGRSLKDRSNDDLLNAWVTTVERWFRGRSSESQHDMDDAAAEIRLRGLTAPEERVSVLLKEMRDEIARDPGELNEGARRRLEEFSIELRKPNIQKH